MPKVVSEIKVTRAAKKVEIQDKVLQQGTAPAKEDPAANIAAFTPPGDAPMPPVPNFNMAGGGKLPSEDPMAFARANPHFPYNDPAQPQPGHPTHELAMHNQFGQGAPMIGKAVRPMVGSFTVEIPDSNPVFINFYHQGLRKYVSRKFSKSDHGKKFMQSATDFAHNPNNSWWSHLGGWLHPTASENPHYEVL